ncbi:carotenoid biosynthesis protein [Heliorestis convoluta]|uniref:Carotenoid biosynthesis protein n=1 Tax=Heliorestis convoluta TaxID=356322 RepID=A0A5Q2N2B5_9FIRM|nr:carotenoid biosynthesis protein [Heliorestis convoluta]
MQEKHEIYGKIKISQSLLKMIPFILNRKPKVTKKLLRKKVWYFLLLRIEKMQKKDVPAMIAKIFWFWYAVGLVLLFVVGDVPAILHFSNGLFNLFYALYALELDSALREKWTLVWGRAIIIAFSTFFLEWFGTKTGLLFGDYSYTHVLGVALGTVPWQLPGLGWVSSSMLSCYQERPLDFGEAWKSVFGLLLLIWF